MQNRCSWIVLAVIYIIFLDLEEMYRCSHMYFSDTFSFMSPSSMICHGAFIIFPTGFLMIIQNH